MLAKLVYVGSNNTSYQQAQADLDQLAELEVSDKKVRRHCKRFGDERIDERDAAVAAYQALPLVERKSAPAGVTPPAVAVVGVDGGRVQIFERPASAAAAPQHAAAEPVPEPALVVAATATSAAVSALPGPALAASAMENEIVPQAAAERWIQGMWSGAAEQVIAELAVRQAELGMPAKDEPEGSPRAVVARALTYLQNNKERMRYADYRRRGLPITSSYVESTVKQINYRVKGTEKFWNEAGAEELLQLRADYLSDGDVMARFWERREINETGQNRCRRAA